MLRLSVNRDELEDDKESIKALADLMEYERSIFLEADGDVEGVVIPIRLWNQLQGVAERLDEIAHS